MRDEARFAGFSRRHAAPVTRALYAMTGDSPEAQGVVEAVYGPAA